MTEAISHHIQCLNNQQLFYYIALSKKQRKKQANKPAALFTCISLYFRTPTFSMYEDADQLLQRKCALASEYDNRWTGHMGGSKPMKIGLFYVI